MNCNPFTLGYKALIEWAANTVDELFIFVVEEDKSAFRFSDRINMVKQGTAHIKNVHVFSSGRFMISAQTFPEYFTKDSQSENVLIDPSLDIRIFGKYIANEVISASRVRHALKMGDFDTIKSLVPESTFNYLK